MGLGCWEGAHLESVFFVIKALPRDSQCLLDVPAAHFFCGLECILFLCEDTCSFYAYLLTHVSHKGSSSSFASLLLLIFSLKILLCFSSLKEGKVKDAHSVCSCSSSGTEMVGENCPLDSSWVFVQARGWPHQGALVKDNPPTPPHFLGIYCPGLWFSIAGMLGGERFCS